MLTVVENEASGEGLESRSLDELAREGAQRMLLSALEEEVVSYLERHPERDEGGHRLVVRNGKARARKVICGAGTLKVKAPRVDDQRVDEGGERQRFTSQILPPYMRRSPKVSEALPVLYLRGLSTGDFRPALRTLLGEDAAGLSATNITRLTEEWEDEYRQFQKRRFDGRDYVYIWADGVHFNVRLEDDRLCTLVLLGARADGTKELLAVADGYRESQESWLSLLRDLSRRGLRAPVVAVGDRALGFWAALREVWPETREQLDWCHKLANVLDKLPQRLQGKAKTALRSTSNRSVLIGRPFVALYTNFGTTKCLT
jgi:transposase-like protein